MTLIVEWPVALILAAAFVALAWVQSRCPGQGGIDTVPGNGIGQAPDMEYVESRVGFRHG
jgi:hypothetical protein